jgi:hypothetical protein
MSKSHASLSNSHFPLNMRPTTVGSNLQKLTRASSTHWTGTVQAYGQAGSIRSRRGINSAGPE